MVAVNGWFSLVMQKHLPRPLFFALTLLGVCALLGSCSEKRKTIGAIRAAYNKSHYEEAIVLCEHALRHDIHDGQVYYYYGLALLAKGRDFEALKRFREAATADSLLKTGISKELLASGKGEFDRGDTSRAADRLRAAVEFDSLADLGRLKFLVADAYFDDRDFTHAEKLYADAVREWPDTAAAEQAFFNLAASRLSLADSAGALDALEAQLEHFPRGSLAMQARFREENLLYEHANSEFQRGNYDAVVEEIQKLLEKTTNNTLVQRARFLLGEAYERLEDYHAAYEQYQAIIEKDRGASGRIVERARQKINAFKDSGLL
jgi:tetratricopeptide (TPR) repeat protein